MIFVDEHERVYSSWKHYKRSNQLPSSFVVAPKRGIYMTQKGKYNTDNIYEIYNFPSQ